MGVKETRDPRDETHYVILWQEDGRAIGDWSVMVDLYASSATEAIKKAAGDEPDAAGMYVAVPARSWKPMRVEQVQTVQTVITAADETTEPKGDGFDTKPVPQ